ncbi:MAG: hypothetical protein PHW64_08100 [Sulfuricurvum sp.]|nr:hypothetical protein [Sulfuricurvum sp.]
MRRGSVAIVPLILALMLFFWFIWFMGGENDSLMQINKVEHVQHLQEELMIAAMQRHLATEQDLRRSNPNISDINAKAAADLDADQYVKIMMQNNQIDPKGTP